MRRPGSVVGVLAAGPPCTTAFQRSRRSTAVGENGDESTTTRRADPPRRRGGREPARQLCVCVLRARARNSRRQREKGKALLRRAQTFLYELCIMRAVFYPYLPLAYLRARAVRNEFLLAKTLGDIRGAVLARIISDNAIFTVSVTRYRRSLRDISKRIDRPRESQRSDFKGDRAV